MIEVWLLLIHSSNIVAATGKRLLSLFVLFYTAKILVVIVSLLIIGLDRQKAGLTRSGDGSFNLPHQVFPAIRYWKPGVVQFSTSHFPDQGRLHTWRSCSLPSSTQVLPFQYRCTVLYEEGKTAPRWCSPLHWLSARGTVPTGLANNWLHMWILDKPRGDIEMRLQLIWASPSLEHQ